MITDGSDYWICTVYPLLEGGPPVQTVCTAVQVQTEPVPVQIAKMPADLRERLARRAVQIEERKALRAVLAARRNAGLRYRHRNRLQRINRTPPEEDQ
jgi:hypothetical protein